MTQQNNIKEGIVYSGHVKVTTMYGKKIQSVKEYHNTGTQNLFTFFANCLWGASSSAAEAYRPVKLVLFKQYTTTDESEQVTDNYNYKYWTESQTVSIPAFYDKTPTGDGSLGPTDVYDGETIIGKAVSLHFRVPYIYLENNAKIAKMALFPASVTYSSESNEYGNMLAYYKITNDKGTAFDPIEVPGVGENFTVIVDWTLKIVNAE